MIFESVKFALSWFISLKCTCDETEGVPIWKGHAHPCPPRMDRTLAAEEQYRQQDGGSSLKRGHHDISWPQRSSYYKIYKGILHSRTLQVSEGKRSIFSRLLKKNLWNMISFIFPRLMWRDITTIFPQPRSTGPQLMGCEGTAWNTSGYRTGGFKMLYALVNVNKKLWKDPPCYSWVNQLFRLGHFQ